MWIMKNYEFVLINIYLVNEMLIKNITKKVKCLKSQRQIDGIVLFISASSFFGAKVC